MYELIIIGATSNICKTKVFKNLNNLNKFNKIYCYGWENWNNDEFIFYLLTNVQGNIINLIPSLGISSLIKANSLYERIV